MSNSTSKAAQNIADAQAAVVKADEAYRKGGSLDALNAANDRLASAHNDLYEAEGGVIPDNRGN